MKRILKHVKPYIFLILIAIGLLFAQANLELSLPDYMSDIVDKGIQQGGVEYAVPIAIRQSKMENIFVFVDPENQTKVLSDYRLITENSSDYSELLDSYPILENESIYLLNEHIKKKTIEEYEEILINAIVTSTVFEQIAANNSQVVNATEIYELLGIDPSTLPPGTSLFDVVKTLPLEQRLLISSAIANKFKETGEMMLKQVAIFVVRAEYEVIGMDTDKIQLMYILKAGALMLGVTLLSVLCVIGVGYIASKTSAGIARNIRSDLFDKVENFSRSEFDTFSTASLITRSTNDVTQIQTVTFMIIRMVFYAPILGVGAIIHALAKSKNMWWLIGVAVALLMILIIIIFLVAVPKFKLLQKLTDRINRVARENLSGILVIRAFNREKYEEKRFDVENRDLTAVSLFVNRLLVILMPFMMLVMNGMMISIIWIGAHQVSDGAMQVGDMMAFMQYAMQIVISFLMLTMMFIILPRAVVSARRINEVLITEPIIKDPEQPKKFPEPFQGKVEFNNVCFRYPGAKKCAVENVTFTANPGETIAFIGPTGSGKSTIVNLIPRFYDVTEGTIKIDGIDIREVTQHDLRDKIGFVPQKTTLFSGTIESNLRFADENATEETLYEALEIAQAIDFVKSKPKGLKTEIAQKGANVSGGQKQRLAIARALVKRAPIYIFDDSFSALDFKTESRLRKALREKTGKSTVFLVSQRISTIKNSDLIIVLDGGRIIGKGTHEELMETCEMYRSIATSQLELEELK
ncbi:MAG: ABC transporter ATP-binding protein/permease [Candidatus Heimdallarchaeum aukensis]|uniref:ABC transporter ATP-binding protein/permease n=1 Tax=Candidatus Heimdallarchaeum aukensis TaxID=2876573 RepID=A0A9Y1BLG0_9ARCH|nr:MAG: ABC transporter ATP-binding protein/permease [Candidatus Heimdallarchaeum aukensis]